MEHWLRKGASPSTELLFLAEYSTDVFARLRADMTFSYISPSSERLFRRPPAEVVGRPVRDFVFPEDLPVIATATARVSAGEADSATVTVRAIRGDGSLVWVEVTSAPIGDLATGRLLDRAVVIRDVTERKALEDQLRAMAMKDGLTGLSNRRAFDEALARAWGEAVHTGGHLSLLLLDLDHFKGFNDAYGHLVGDDCLRAIAAALLALPLEGEDLIARYGGEEIAIVLPGAPSERALDIAVQARHAVEALTIPHQASSAGVVTMSIGAATAIARDGGSAEMPQALLAAADRALYQAKTGGRNRIETAFLLASRA